MKNLGLYFISFGVLATSTLAKKWPIQGSITLNNKISAKKSIFYDHEESYVDTEKRQIVVKYKIEDVPYNMTFNYLPNEEVVFEQDERKSECSFEAQKISWINPKGKRKGRNQFYSENTMKFDNSTMTLKPKYDYEYYRIEFGLVDCHAELRTEVPTFQRE